MKNRFRLVSAFFAVVLLVWPLLFADVLRPLPIGLAISVCGISLFCGVVILSVSFTKYLNEQGRAWGPARPTTGIAGKAWSMLAPSIVLPPTLAIGFSFLSYALLQQIYVIGAAIALLILTHFTCLYVSSLRKCWRQRQVLTKRNLEQSFIILEKESEENSNARCTLDALNVIANTLRVPAGKLRMSDRFGDEIGSFSSFDDTLDKIGGCSLMRKRLFGKSLYLDHIRTLGDFVREWNKCSEISKEK